MKTENGLFYLSIRKIFGTLFPGFALFIFIFLISDKTLTQGIIPSFIINDDILRYVSILFLSYFLGTFNIELSWRILSLFGQGTDSWVSHKSKTNNSLKLFFKFLSEKIHIFSLQTIEEKTKREFPSENNNNNKGKEEYGGAYWKAKMEVFGNSSALLIQEIIEMEADISFCAGIFLPTLFLGGYLTFHSVCYLGIPLILAAIFFALKFQHLRQDDIEFISNAQKGLKNENREAGKS